MKLEYDKDVDCAYIYLGADGEDERSTQTVELNDNIIVDFDKEGKLLGIEILDASKVLSSGSLAAAKQKV